MFLTKKLFSLSCKRHTRRPYPILRPAQRPSGRFFYLTSPPFLLILLILHTPFPSISYLVISRSICPIQSYLVLFVLSSPISFYLSYPVLFVLSSSTAFLVLSRPICPIKFHCNICPVCCVLAAPNPIVRPAQRPSGRPKTPNNKKRKPPFLT